MLTMPAEHDKGKRLPEGAKDSVMLTNIDLQAMAAHHAPQGIRVNCVCPGMVYSPMMYSGGMTEEAREARKNRSLLKTEGNGWDVGAAVRFLAGDEARWMTGVILPVDAGATVAAGSELPKSASVNPPKEAKS